METTLSKQYEALATKWAKSWENNFFFKARIILTALSVTALSIFLVIVTTLVYLLFIQQISLEHPLNSSFSEPTDNFLTQEQELLHETRETLLNAMFFVNGMMILISIFPLYILTRKILHPIEQAHMKQKRLIADVSHELRTPLAIMLSGVESALLDKKISKKCQDVLHTQYKDLTYLKNITDDLLFIEDTSEKKTHTLCNLDEIAKKSMAMILPYAEAHEIICRFKSSPDTKKQVAINRVQIQRLILNLLKNAIDYSPKNTHVQMLIEKSKEHIILSITDEGIGMKKKDIKHITDRFYKADTSRNSNGSGLGLALVAHIAKAHDAQLDITSSMGKGTTVSVSLPIPSS